MRVRLRFAAAAFMVAAACGWAAHGQAVGMDASAPSTDLIAGGRMMTESGVLTLYTPNPTPANGLIWPGPYMEASRKKVPVGRIGSDPTGVYYRCRFAYTNWYQGPGHSLLTSAIGHKGDSLLTVGSVASVMPGDTIVGVGIPPGETVDRIDSPTGVWISTPLTASLVTAATIASRPASYGTNAGELFDTGGAIKVSAGVRPAFGDTGAPPMPLRFGGRAVAIIPPGQTLWSDWAAFTARPGKDLEVDTTVYWPAGSYVFAGHVGRADLGEDNTLFAATPSLLGDSADPSREARPHWSGSANRATYGPANMICSTHAPAAGHASLVIVGDSDATGTDDNRTFDPSSKTYADIGDAAGYAGPWERAAEALQLAHFTMGQSGKRLADLVRSSQLLLSLMGDAPTYVVLELGVNDFGGGRVSAEAAEANWIKAVNLLQQGGRKVIATTVGPETTTTDGGATTANQKPGAGFAVGEAAQAFNDWIRTTGAPTYTGGRLVDIADIVMSGRDSQVFRTDIAPFADWYGYVVGMSWWPGVGGAAGVYDIIAKGGGCAVQPAVRVRIAKGSIDTVVLTRAGLGCTSAPSIDMGVIPGFHNATINLRVLPLQLGVHYHSGYDYTHATFLAEGAKVTGATLIDGQAAVAAAVKTQLQAALAK